MTFFVKARAWQLFLIVAGGMVPGNVIFVINEMIGAQSLLVGSVASAASLGWAYACMYGWWWALGTHLNRKVFGAAPNRTRLFSFSVAWLAAFTTVLLILFVGQFTGRFAPLKLSTGRIVFLVAALVDAFCGCYVVYFVTKALKRARVYGNLTRVKYAGLLALVFVFPLGVWFIQPRVNALFASGKPKRT